MGILLSHVGEITSYPLAQKDSETIISLIKSSLLEIRGHKIASQLRKNISQEVLFSCQRACSLVSYLELSGFGGSLASSQDLKSSVNSQAIPGLRWQIRIKLFA